MAERETEEGKLYEDRHRVSERGRDRRGRGSRKGERKGKEPSALFAPRLQTSYEKAIL